jgi:hypothetical protein
MAPLSISHLAALAGLALSQLAMAAIPENLVPWAIPGCGAMPAFNNDTKTAGPWSIQAVSTDSEIEDHTAVAIFSRGATSIRWGYVCPSRTTIFQISSTDVHLQFSINDAAGVATNPLKCDVGGTIKGWVPTGVGGYTWEALAVPMSYPYDAPLMYFVPGEAARLYLHYVNGEEQRGAFVGAAGVTTWGFKETTDTEFGTYWYARLLVPGGEQLAEGEVTGFLKVVGS